MPQAHTSCYVRNDLAAHPMLHDTVILSSCKSTDLSSQGQNNYMRSIVSIGAMYTTRIALPCALARGVVQSCANLISHELRVQVIVEEGLGLLHGVLVSI